MKGTTYLTTAILFILVLTGGCKNASNTAAISPPMTGISPGEKEIVRKEISGRIDEIINGVKDLDVDAA